ncbi:glycosyltransferase family 4 protein [Gelidibacter pelagius]|uniref:Glycosyltransferase family 4 protein n=1 Tax=Gelidibacter pelagius TaxID=2819985 RepID=A0ABS3SW19_9FLAO|nr:glycosyltransferase family 4 protein [Gelidibacter pelagius]MBO3099904.1 glycosyltransferase family 4 protein [Gelidibacter pelagius]
MIIGIILSKPPGYSETFFNSKIKGLKKNGYKIVLFTGPTQEKYGGCTHIKSPKVYKYFILQVFKMFLVGFQLLPHLKAVRNYFKLERQYGSSLKRSIEKIYMNSELLKFKGDWLHFGFATLTIDRELVAQAIGAKMAVSLRGYDINVYPLKHPSCYKLLWKQVNKVHSISHFLLQKAWLLGLSKHVPYQIISPAVDLSSLPSTKNHNSKGIIKIVTIARLHWIKGIDYLIEVAKCLRNAKVNFEWLVIGSGLNAETERYMYLLKERELETQVILKGACSHSETLNCLAAADMYVQTSLNEGFCNAVLEAQALGIPSLAFKVGGLPENIRDKETGWLIEPYDVEAMAKIIIDISEFSFKEKEAFTKRVIKRVQNDFNLEQQKQAFDEFYMK